MHYEFVMFYKTGPRGLYYKILGIRNVQQMDIFRKKLVLSIVNHIHIVVGKRTSLLRNLYITTL
jgi:hypothetical protein